MIHTTKLVIAAFDTIKRPEFARTVLIEPMLPGRRTDFAEVVILPELHPDHLLGGDALTFSQPEYRNQLWRRSDLITPLLRMARQGPVILAYVEARVLPCMQALEEIIAEQLHNEDLECMDREPSSPTCYYPSDTDAS